MKKEKKMTLEFTERTPGVLIGAWESRRDVKNLMGKYANCLILNRNEEITELLWSKRDDIALGFNDGWYIGPEEIARYYTSETDRAKLVTSLLKKALSDKLEGKSEEELYGIGTFRVLPMSCPVVRVAGDGRTAKGLWYCQGSYAKTEVSGPVSYWVWAYYAADFVFEDGAWRIWHLKCLTDLCARCGSDWGKQAEPLPALTDFEVLNHFETAKPNKPEELWQVYTPARPLTAPLKLPEDYDTFADTFSYGPEETAEAGDAIRAETALPADVPEEAISEEDARLLERTLDIEQIGDLMNRRVYYVSADRREDELRDLWVKGDEAQLTASMGKNWGFYVGIDEIKRFYLEAHAEKLRLQQEENRATDPNIGNVYAHPLTTGLIEVADDGRSARGLWYSIAQETYAEPGGTAHGRWILEKIAVDFLKEADAWRIWHIMTAVDLSCGAGEDYEKQPVYFDPGEDIDRADFGRPTIEKLVHENVFNWWDDYPPVPEPYRTFTKGMGYGPDGFREPGLKNLGAGEGRNIK
jgi:hypothetical protein